MRGRVGVAVAIVAVAVLAGGGWFVAQRQAHEILAQGVAQFRERLGPDVRFDYASAVPSVLHRNARFVGVALSGPNGTAGADTMVVGCDAASVCSGVADGVRLDGTGAAAVSGTIGHVGWTRLSVPPAGDGAAGPLGGRFDAAEARGVHLTGSGSEIDAAAVSMADYGAGRRGRGSVDILAVSVPDPSAGGGGTGGAIRLAVAHAAFDGVDVAAAAGAVRSGGGVAAQGRQTLEVTGLDVAQGGAALLHVGRFGSVSDTSPDAGSADAAPGGVGSGGAQAGAASGVTHGVADATELRLDGPPAAMEGLRGLGYPGFAGEMHVDATLDRAAGALSIAAVRLSGQGMGQASLSGGFGHVPQGAAAASPGAALGMTLRGFDLALVDGGLMQHVLDAKAKAAGMDAAALRAAIVQQVSALPVSSAAAVSVRDALASFVRAPGTLTIGVHPAAPLSMLEVAQLGGRAGGPDGVVQALGMTASAR